MSRTVVDPPNNAPLDRLMRCGLMLLQAQNPIPLDRPVWVSLARRIYTSFTYSCAAPSFSSRRPQSPQRNPQLLHRRIHILKIQRRNRPLGMLLRLQHALIIAVILARRGQWLRHMRRLWLLQRDRGLRGQCLCRRGVRLQGTVLR